MSVPINDPTDDRLTDFVALADPVARRRRERDEIFIAEGLIAVQRLVESRHRVRSVLVTPNQFDRVAAIVAGVRAPIYVATQAVLEATVGFNLHRGILASASRQPLPSVASVIEGATRLAVLEGLNDPENLGLIARTARAFGVDALLLDPTCIDPYYRRAVRVSMGEILLLAVARCEAWPSELDVIHGAGFETWAMTPSLDAEHLGSLAVPERLAVILGAEGPGLAAGTMAAARRRVRIPISPAVDSLNVGHAAAITFAAVTDGARPASPVVSR